MTSSNDVVRGVILVGSREEDDGGNSTGLDRQRDGRDTFEEGKRYSDRYQLTALEIQNSCEG